MNEDKTEEIILIGDDKAATYRTDISGWVSLNGIYCGKDEKYAKYAGATHRLCEKCKKPIKKHRSLCEDCQRKKEEAKYDNMPKSIWNGIDALYSDSHGRWFFDWGEIIEYCEDEDCSCDSLKLIIGTPIYATEINPNYYYEDDLPEEVDVPDELWQAFEELNKMIKTDKVVLAWTQGKFAAILDKEEPTENTDEHPTLIKNIKELYSQEEDK